MCMVFVVLACLSRTVHPRRQQTKNEHELLSSCSQNFQMQNGVHSLLVEVGSFACSKYPESHAGCCVAKRSSEFETVGFERVVPKILASPSGSASKPKITIQKTLMPKRKVVNMRFSSLTSKVRFRSCDCLDIKQPWGKLCQVRNAFTKSLRSEQHTPRNAGKSLALCLLIHRPRAAFDVSCGAVVPYIQARRSSSAICSVNEAGDAISQTLPSDSELSSQTFDRPDPPPFEEPGLVRDALAGLTVAFSLLSKAIACSAIVGVEPLVGVWSSVVMGFAAPALGMRPGVIAGSAAVVVVPLGAFVAENGSELIPLVVLLAALIEGAVGALKLTRLVDLVSEDVLAGFLNGLGVLLFTSQLKVFTGAPELLPAVGLAALCAAVTEFLPRFTSAEVPSSLIGLAVASAVGRAFDLPLATLASTADASAFAGGLASLPTPIDFSSLAALATSPEKLAVALPTSISIAFISVLETLLAAKLVDELKCEEMCVFFYEGIGEQAGSIAGGDVTGASPQEQPSDVPTSSVIALAAGNGASALLGGFGGCGLIPQTVLNLNSGGGGTASSVAYAAALATFVLVLAPLVGQVSQAALAGLLITVSYSTVQWGATRDAIVAALPRDTADGNLGDTKTQRTLAQARTSLASLLLASVVCYQVDFASGIVAGVIVERALSTLDADDTSF